MLKKAAPALFATAVVLAGCNGNDEDALPADNETPMEDIQEGNDEMFDGNGDGSGDGMGGEGTNGPVDPDGTGPGFGEFGGNDDGGGTDSEKRDEIMEDDLDRNGNGNGGGMGGG